MTKHYTQAVPTDLLHKLYNAGMPKIHFPSPRKRLPGGMVLIEAVDVSKIPTYAYVLDWFAEQGLWVYVGAIYYQGEIQYIGAIMGISEDKTADISFGYRKSFDDAARPAIEKALELLKK